MFLIGYMGGGNGHKWQKNKTEKPSYLMVGLSGLEPETSVLSGLRSNQLS
jgi:hypothetical protein